MVVQSMVKLVNSLLRFKVPELFRTTTATATTLPKNIERGKLMPFKSVYSAMSIHNMHPIIPESSSINVDNEKISEQTTENEFNSNPINSLATEGPPSMPTQSPSVSPATIEKCNIDNPIHNVDKEKAYYYEDDTDTDNESIEKKANDDDAEYFLKKGMDQTVEPSNEIQSTYVGSGIKVYVPKKCMTFATKRHNLHELPPGTPNDQRIIFKLKPSD